MIEWLQLSQQQAADHGRFLWGSAANKEDLPPWLFWTYLGVSIGLVSMAGLMSGLTLGLMSLDELDLEVCCCDNQAIHHVHRRDSVASSMFWGVIDHTSAGM
jgi:hypothetical protein